MITFTINGETYMVPVHAILYAVFNKEKANLYLTGGGYIKLCPSMQLWIRNSLFGIKAKIKDSYVLNGNHSITFDE